LFTSFVDFLKDVSIEIDKSLDDEIARKTAEIISCKTDMKIAMAEYAESKQEVWTQYMGTKQAVEKDDPRFFGLVANELNKIILPRFLMIYRNASKAILNEALNALETVKMELAKCLQMPEPIKKMEISPEEQKKLDTIWIVMPDTSTAGSEDDIQHAETRMTMQDIQGRINDLMVRLTKK
jgi:hypothetical protein